MKGIVEKIQGEWVTLEMQGEMKILPSGFFPYDLKEGQIVEKIEDKWVVDLNESKKRKEEIVELMKKAFKSQDY